MSRQARAFGRRCSGVLSAILVSGALGCDGAGTRTLVITTHAFENACGVGLRAAEDAELSLTPFGDYPRVDARTLSLRAHTAEVEIPEGTRAVRGELRIDGTTYLGYAERGPNDELPILLWPLGRACRLDAQAGGYPGDGGGQGLAYDRASRSVLLAGGDDPDQMNRSDDTLVFDTGTGKSRLGRGLSEPRAFASVAPFGGSFLIGGGEDPWNSEGRVIKPSATAELVPLESGAGAPGPLGLSLARTRHSAAVLPNGDVLFVGGLDQFSRAPNLLEAVTLASRARDVAFPALQVPRLFPSLLALDDGRLFIGGGSAADGSPLSAFEWLSGDARTRRGLATPEELPARHDRAFAAMPGGGTLVLGGCAPRAPEPDEDCGMCRAGCPPRGAAGNVEYDAWWVLPDDSRVRLGASPDAPRPVLLGSAGRPVLAPGVGPRLYRFDPWRAEFQEEPALDLACPPRAGLPAVALDAATFAWVTERASCAEGPALFGLRTGADSGHTGAIGLVPDRPPAGLADYVDGVLGFTGESALRVYLEGAYDDFALSFTVDETSSAAPKLVLLAADGAGPRLLDIVVTPGRAVRIERSGPELRAGGRRAEVPSGPLHVGFASGPNVTRLSTIAVDRGLPP